MDSMFAGAKNIRPGIPDSLEIKCPAWEGNPLPLYEMLYDPYDKKTAPARDQTSKAQG